MGVTQAQPCAAFEIELGVVWLRRRSWLRRASDLGFGSVVLSTPKRSASGAVVL
jgi:hypothetical protein